VSISEAKPAAWVLDYAPVALCVGDVEGVQTELAVVASRPVD